MKKEEQKEIKKQFISDENDGLTADEFNKKKYEFGTANKKNSPWKNYKPSFAQIIEEMFPFEFLEKICKDTNAVQKMKPIKVWQSVIQSKFDLEVMINKQIEEFQQLGDENSGKWKVQKDWREIIDSTEKLAKNSTIPEEIQNKYRIIF